MAFLFASASGAPCRNPREQAAERMCPWLPAITLFLLGSQGLSQLRHNYWNSGSQPSQRCASCWDEPLPRARKLFHCYFITTVLLPLWIIMYLMCKIFDEWPPRRLWITEQHHIWTMKRTDFHYLFQLASLAAGNGSLMNGAREGEMARQGATFCESCSHREELARDRWPFL